jgi:pyroglutamyl-peptidase
MKLKTLFLISFVIYILTNSTIINSQSINLIEEESITVLVVGFGPFLNHDINPSELIAAELNGETISNAEIISLQIKPNLSNFSESIEIVYQAIETYNPDYIFSIGLAAKNDNIRIEKIGLNLKYENKENSKLEKLIPNAPFLYISPFPTIKIVRELREKSIPSQTSLFAGLSLCNGMTYSVLHYIDIKNLDIKSGFIHVPLHKSDENPNAMELYTMVNATRIIIKVCLEYYY